MIADELVQYALYLGARNQKGQKLTSLKRSVGCS
jgi:hypothetical protein